MPTPYPEEFRRDVIVVAGEGGRSRAQVARSFGIAESWLARWLRIAGREDGLDEAAAPAAASGGDLAAENRELRRRAKQLEQETRSCPGRWRFARDTPSK